MNALQSSTVEEVRAKDGIHCMESFFSDGRLKAFVENYNDILSKQDNPEVLSYFGVNFLHGELHTVKFYAHVFHNLDGQEVLRFLPVSDDYLQYLPFRPLYSHNNIFKNVGIAFELKFNASSKEASIGFFYLLDLQKSQSQSVCKPLNLPPKILEKRIATGINFEYSPGSTLKKCYHYFHSADVMGYFGDRFAAIPLMEESDFIEYAESEKNAKINLYGSRFSALDKMLTVFDACERAIICHFNERYGLANFEFGRYEGLPIKSVYFFGGDSRKHQGVLNLDTLRYDLHTLNQLV